MSLPWSLIHCVCPPTASWQSSLSVSPYSIIHAPAKCNVTMDGEDWRGWRRHRFVIWGWLTAVDPPAPSGRDCVGPAPHSPCRTPVSVPSLDHFLQGELVRRGGDAFHKAGHSTQETPGGKLNVPPHSISVRARHASRRIAWSKPSSINVHFILEFFSACWWTVLPIRCRLPVDTILFFYRTLHTCNTTKKNIIYNTHRDYNLTKMLAKLTGMSQPS